MLIGFSTETNIEDCIRKKLPWTILLALFVSALVHMLMLRREICEHRYVRLVEMERVDEKRSVPLDFEV
jgi:hypothetical protein